MAAGSLFLGIDSLRRNWFRRGIDFSQESMPPVRNFLSDSIRKRERAHVLYEKSIPTYKIEVSWAIGGSISRPGSYLVSTRFQAPTAASKIRALRVRYCTHKTGWIAQNISNYIWSLGYGIGDYWLVLRDGCRAGKANIRRFAECFSSTVKLKKDLLKYSKILRCIWVIRKRFYSWVFHLQQQPSNSGRISWFLSAF